MKNLDVKKIREKLGGITQTHLANLIGLNMRTVQNYEKRGEVPEHIYKAIMYEVMKSQDNKPQPPTVENKEKPNNQAMDYNKQQRYYELLEENYILKKENEELRKELTGKKVPDHRAG